MICSHLEAYMKVGGEAGGYFDQWAECVFSLGLATVLKVR
jgi:hypothetical protein